MEEEKESTQADGTVNPERSTASQSRVHRWERESEGAASHPQGEGTGSHGYATDTVGEDLCQ